MYHLDIETALYYISTSGGVGKYNSGEWMNSSSPVKFYGISFVLIILGFGLGNLVGLVNTLIDDNQKLEESRQFKMLSHDVRKALSRDHGCSNALAAALIYPVRKQKINKAYLIDGFNMPDGEQLKVGKFIKKYQITIDSMEINNLNGIGRDSEGHDVYTALLEGRFSGSSFFGPREKKILSHLLITLDNREKLVSCSNKLSGDAIQIMASLCEGSKKVYSRDSGHCHSHEEMTRHQRRAISSVK